MTEARNDIRKGRNDEQLKSSTYSPIFSKRCYNKLVRKGNNDCGLELQSGMVDQ